MWGRVAWVACVTLWLLWAAGGVGGAQEAGEETIPEPRMLVDAPTAGLLPRGTYDLDLRLFGEGGLVGAISVGITPRLTIGLSYGGARLLGSDDPDWYPRPEVRLKYRLVEESDSVPALAVGFDFAGLRELHPRERHPVAGVGALRSREHQPVRDQIEGLVTPF